MRRLSVAIPVVLITAAAVSCGPPPSRPAVEVTAVHRATLPEDPADAAWQGSPLYKAELLLQDLVEPRLLKVSTKTAQVRAFTDGQRVAVRLEWSDPTRDDLPGAARFADASAIQLPARTERDAPDPQMGQKGRAVEITYWSAFWQASVDGRADTIKAIYPGAAPDHYPFEAPSLKPGSEDQKAMAARFAPARALGNLMGGGRDRPVQDLVAEGPGTLTTAAKALSSGSGLRTAGGWAVVCVRPLPAGLKPGGQSQIAVAVWDGSNNEAGSRKMRSAWIPFLVEKAK